MADFYAYAGMPGPSAVALTTERQAVLGPITWYLLKGITINGSVATDAGNTPTTELRPGLIMALRNADGFAVHYQPNAVDGTQVAQGLLWEARRTIDTDGLTVNRPGQMVVAGYIKASQVLLLDEQARRQFQGRLMFDDRLTPPLGGFTQTVPKTTSYTVVAGTQSYIQGPATQGDNNTYFTTTGAGGPVVFTLPAPAKGNRFRFTNTVNQNMTITAPAGTLIGFNNAAATNIAFTTAGNLIGASVEIVADDTGTKWIALPYAPNTATVT